MILSVWVSAGSVVPHGARSARGNLEIGTDDYRCRFSELERAAAVLEGALRLAGQAALRPTPGAGLLIPRATHIEAWLAPAHR